MVISYANLDCYSNLNERQMLPFNKPTAIVMKISKIHSGGLQRWIPFRVLFRTAEDPPVSQNYDKIVDAFFSLPFLV